MSNHAAQEAQYIPSAVSDQSNPIDITADDAKAIWQRL
jgi:hypothetical protein